MIDASLKCLICGYTCGITPEGEPAPEYLVDTDRAPSLCPQGHGELTIHAVLDAPSFRIVSPPPEPEPEVVESRNLSVEGDWLDLALELERLSFEKHEEANRAFTQGRKVDFLRLGGHCTGLRDAAEKIRARVIKKEIDDAR